MLTPLGLLGAFGAAAPGAKLDPVMFCLLARMCSSLLVLRSDSAKSVLPRLLDSTKFWSPRSCKLRLSAISLAVWGAFFFAAATVLLLAPSVKDVVIVYSGS